VAEIAEAGLTAEALLAAAAVTPAHSSRDPAVTSWEAPHGSIVAV
jgi:hypothetical protein